MSSHANSLFLRESGQRLGRLGWLQRLQESLQQRALRTRLRLQTMTREHVLRFLRKNAFILLTVSAVIIGECAGRAATAGKIPCTHVSLFCLLILTCAHAHVPFYQPPHPRYTDTVHTHANTAVCAHNVICVCICTYMHMFTLYKHAFCI